MSCSSGSAHPGASKAYDPLFRIDWSYALSDFDLGGDGVRVGRALLPDPESASPSKFGGTAAW